MRFHRLQNVQIALDYLKRRQVRINPTGPSSLQLSFTHAINSALIYEACINSYHYFFFTFANIYIAFVYVRIAPVTGFRRKSL